MWTALPRPFCVKLTALAYSPLILFAVAQFGLDIRQYERSICNDDTDASCSTGLFDRGSTSFGTVTGSISGSMKNGSSTFNYFPSFTARRIPWHKSSMPATEYAASYTASLQGSGISEPNTPVGTSVITSTIDTSGNVKAAIRLADGTARTCATKIADNGQIPLYALCQSVS